MMNSQLEKPSERDKLSPLHLLRQQFSLREMLAVVSIVALGFAAGRGTYEPIKDGLIVMFFGVWFWRQYEQSRTKPGALCGLPTPLIVVLAGQSLGWYGLNRAVNGVWHQLGTLTESNGEFLIGSELSEVMIWFPVLITALPLGVRRLDDCPSVWERGRELLGICIGLVIASALAFHFATVCNLTADSVRAVLATQPYRRGPFVIMEYSDHAQPIQTAYEASLVTAALVAGALVLLAFRRWNRSQNSFFYKSVSGFAVGLSLLSIVNSWHLIYRLLPATSPLVFPTKFRLEARVLVAYLVVTWMVWGLFFRASRSYSEELVTEPGVTSGTRLQGWLWMLGRQWAAFLGLAVLLWSKFGWMWTWDADIGTNVSRILIDTLSDRIVWFGEDRFYLAVIIALLCFAWQMRRPRFALAGQIVCQTSLANTLLQTLWAMIHLIALSMAIYVVSATTFAVHPSPLDFLVPRPR